MARGRPARHTATARRKEPKGNGENDHPTSRHGEDSRGKGGAIAKRSPSLSAGKVGPIEKIGLAGKICQLPAAASSAGSPTAIYSNILQFALCNFQFAIPDESIANF
jgi:hypothetical protein